MSQITFDFSGQKFVVTGASSGIGRQIALELAEAGAMVLGLGRRKAALDDIQAQHPDRILTAQCDVTVFSDMERAISLFVENYGKLNGCVHAAGISGLTPLKAFDRVTAEQILEVSLWSAVQLVQLVTKTKYSEHGSSSVLMSSVSASTGEKGMLAYSAAKAGVRTAVKTLAKEIASKGHRIVSISPGWVKTEMTNQISQAVGSTDVEARHLLGIGNSKDISGVVLFLLSDRAGWMTGVDIVVDGGYLA
jgi:NAD(P)-dependent dehydrogenase (short-subunit alcohol dehydrogenase family)